MSKWIFLSLVLVSCGVAVWGSLQLKSTLEPKPLSVVLIVVDTMRGDKYEYTPRLNEFGRSATVFAQAYATAPWTHPSTSSILSGMLPISDRVINARWQIQNNLPGYSSAAVSANPIVTPKDGFLGFGTFDEVPHAPAEVVTRAGIGHLQTLPPPFFLYLHYFDPHDPYGDSTTDVNMVRDILAAGLPIDRGVVWDLERNYNKEISHVDTWVGVLLDNIPEDVLIIFTSDHGEEFLDHGGLKHAHSLYNELVLVPLIVRVPGVQPSVQKDPTSLVSIYDTIIDGELQTWRGPVFSTSHGGWFSADFVGYQQRRAAIFDNYKYIMNLEDNTSEMYDLVVDPLEHHPIIDGERYEGISDELRGKLEALGYIK